MTGLNIVRITDGVPDTPPVRTSWSKPFIHAREEAAFHRGIWLGIFYLFMFELLVYGVVCNYLEKIVGGAE